MLANYNGHRALAALRSHGEIVLYKSNEVVDDPAALIRAAQDIHVMVVDRQTPSAGLRASRFAARIYPHAKS